MTTQTYERTCAARQGASWVIDHLGLDLWLTEFALDQLHGALTEWLLYEPALFDFDEYETDDWQTVMDEIRVLVDEYGEDEVFTGEVAEWTNR